MIGALEASAANGDGPARLYSIGDLAAELEVSQRAIRFYEDRGLLKPQRVGSNRAYTHGDRARLVLILRGKRLGFSLSDIKEMLDLYDVDSDHLEQLRVTLDKGRARIAELERQRSEIDATLAELREIESIVLSMIRERERSSRKRKEGDPS
ncbi:MAG TPA: MerR family DNA-binding transcriptional regulator [Stellaceae bacterium]|nr:MerR family DNA-binding transcriptional regulator [Stellaceae bacterium]